MAHATRTTITPPATHTASAPRARRDRDDRGDGGIRACSIAANGLTFGLLEAGAGPLALCLHGFPDGAGTWRHLLPDLADAGYRAVAPFMRGYAPTTIPANGVYQTAALATDANALHDALGGGDDAVIIGHDWGAAAAYLAAIAAPNRWRGLVTVAVPPAGVLRAALTRYEQLRRSWYMFFFQHPFAADVTSADDFALLDRLWREWSPGYDPTDDLQRVKPSLRKPANLAAALGYYRALLGDHPRDPNLAELQDRNTEVVPVPTLYLHGEHDGCIGAELAPAAAPFLHDASEIEVVPGVGHFLHLERPASFAERVRRFLAPERSSSSATLSRPSAE